MKQDPLWPKFMKVGELYKRFYINKKSLSVVVYYINKNKNSHISILEVGSCFNLSITIGMNKYNINGIPLRTYLENRDAILLALQEIKAGLL